MTLADMTLAEMDIARRDNGNALDAWVRALEATAPIAKQPQRLLSDVIAGVARTHGDSACTDLGA